MEESELIPQISALIIYMGTELTADWNMEVKFFGEKNQCNLGQRERLNIW